MLPSSALLHIGFVECHSGTRKTVYTQSRTQLTNPLGFVATSIDQAAARAFNSNGLQPTSDGLEPNSNGLQPGCVLVPLLL